VLALPASAALSIFGRAKETGRSLRGGRILSRQSRRATESPSFARSIAFRVSTSASPSSSASTASVVLLRAPGGLPLGFPLWPLRKRAPCFVSLFSSILAPNCQPIEHAPACRYGTFWPEAPHGLAGRDLAKDKSNARARPSAICRSASRKSATLSCGRATPPGRSPPMRRASD
jgi:hypothetical protein